MSATSQREADKAHDAFEPKTVTIRHGIFWYFAKEMTVVTDEKTKRLVEQESLVQRIANQNDTIDLPLESDYQRGIQHHAFWTEEEMDQVRNLRAREATHGIAAAAQNPLGLQAPSREQINAADGQGGTDDPKQPLDFDLKEFEEQSDLIEWLQGSGTFDGMRAPNAQEVVKAAQGDPELAKALLEAEPMARGDQGIRQSVEQGLKKIIETHA